MVFYHIFDVLRQLPLLLYLTMLSFSRPRQRQVLMFASKYPGGISSKRIINAFEFLRKRSEEAALAAQREASSLRRQAQAASEQEKTEEDPASAQGERRENSAKNPIENPIELERRPPPWVKNAESLLPTGGAGLVSLMGDMSSLEQRIQGGWNLVIKAGGRYVFAFRCCCCCCC